VVAYTALWEAEMGGLLFEENRFVRPYPKEQAVLVAYTNDVSYVVVIDRRITVHYPF
jgi:hypothetical protein